MKNIQYDTDKLNLIPILEIVNMLNIDLNSSKNCMCFTGHDGKSPSLKFYPTTNTYYCYGCGIGTKPINLVMDYCEKSFLEACEILENQFFGNYSYSIPNISRVINKKKKNIFIPDGEVYQSILNKSSLSQVGINYLKSRGYTIDTIKKYRVFDIENSYSFFNDLKNEWGEERLYKCGLLKLNDNRYRNCWWKYTIVFPYFDISNNTIYLQGRYLNKNDNELRWVNLPNVTSSLYNINILNDCKKGDDVYICEGITDTLSMYQAGKKAVAVMGANNFKKEYIFMLMDFNIHVVPDNDNGGEKFYKNVKKAFEGYKTIKRVAFEKKYNDISEYLQDINYGK